MMSITPMRSWKAFKATVTKPMERMSSMAPTIARTEGPTARCRDRTLRSGGHRDRTESPLRSTSWEVRHRPAMMADVDQIQIVVAHSDRATLRVGDMFLKIDTDEARTDVEVQAMVMAPVPTPEILWRR